MQCCKYTPGMLRQTVTIQRKQTAPDGAGGFSVDWVDLHTVKAHMRSTSGTERYSADRLQATVRIRMICRFIEDINEADRVVFRGKAHQIRYIDNVEYRNRWLEIDLDEGVAT